MAESVEDPIVVLMTASDREEAGRIAEMLIRERFAGCVQILPEMRSIYRWQGEVASESEVLLIAKTTSARFDELDLAVREIHSYEAPEIVALSVTAISGPYLEWLQAAVVPSVD